MRFGLNSFAPPRVCVCAWQKSFGRIRVLHTHTYISPHSTDVICEKRFMNKISHVLKGRHVFDIVIISRFSIYGERVNITWQKALFGLSGVLCFLISHYVCASHHPLRPPRLHPVPSSLSLLCHSLVCHYPICSTSISTRGAAYCQPYTKRVHKMYCVRV